jgi:hypothetical protein
MGNKLLGLPVATALVRGFGPAPAPGALAIMKERTVARILAVTVAYESDAPGDQQPTLIGLPELRQHCRAERVDDLIDDLEMLVEDVHASHVVPGAVLSVIRGGR